LLFPPLYAIVDSTVVTNPLDFARQLADAGVRLIQIRDKRASSRKLFEQSKALADLLVAEASGVHVGQDDLPVEHARSICKPPSWVGISTHNLQQLQAAALTSADYIAVGPIFPTVTKENPDPVVGLEFLRAARRETRKPLVAIGGITLATAESVFEAGADSVAVIRDLAAASGPAEQARKYLTIAERVCFERS